MEPTLKPGEFVLVDPKRAVRDNVMVVADHPHSGEAIIKRVQSVSGSAVWLLSDNEAAGTDSRRFGAIETDSVHGVVTVVLNRPFMAPSSFR